MSQLQFDATQVKPQGDRAPIPAGEYPVFIKSSEVKDTKDTPPGKMLALGMEILDGPIKGQLIFQNVNFINKNPVAQQIGQERLSAICHVCGILQISDSTQLHGRPFRVKIS